MYVHHFLRKVYEECSSNEENPNGGLIGSLKSYVFAYSPKPFYYNIGGHNFNLEEIKHGLLRNNQKAPNNYLRSLNGSDKRLDCLRNYSDCRANFVCLDHPDFLEHIDSFSDDQLEDCLEQFVQEIIEAKVEIDLDEGEITLPKVLETYKSDFGSTDESILQFVFRYLEDDNDYETVLSKVQSKNVIIQYK